MEARAPCVSWGNGMVARGSMRELGAHRAECVSLGRAGWKCEMGRGGLNE